MDKIGAIIVDDEQPARDLIRVLLSKYPQIQVVAECCDGFDGVKQIAALQPQLVFLDIQMPRLNGFEMLELLEDAASPIVIFTTAFDQYAIKAFEHNAIDYILKPISDKRFNNAVDKALHMLQGSLEAERRQLQLTSPAQGSGGFLERVVVRQDEALHIIPEEKILYIESMDDYVRITTETSQFVKKKTLKFFEDALNPSCFIKVHRSFIVRFDSIQKIEAYTKDSYLAFIKNGYKIPVSKSGYANLRQIFR